MPLDAQTTATIAERLESAELHARRITQITDGHSDMSWDDAYAIQDALRARKEARSHKTVGFKCGLISPVEMKKMGVTGPCFGFLSDYMNCAEGSDIDCSRLIQPKAQAQICIVTKAPLRGPGCHVGAVMAAIDLVIPGVEIIDSRYCDSRCDFQGLIADNISAARFVIGGRPRNADELDLRTLGVVMEKNGKIAALAAGAAVLGHPAIAVAMLANHLGARGQELAAGSFVMTGGVTEATEVRAGDHVTARFQDLGSVNVRLV
ncbi:MAG: 2-oxo-3-hexenedioate decarboxylase [Polyangiaceae bacterium]|nr:2-oxo-3-hexenedioate decarboxylase [Polyangiaceae bacterium]